MAGPYGNQPMYDRYVQIKSIGPIPYHGDNYWDGVLDAHNEKYFITLYTQICRGTCSGEEILKYWCTCRDYETVYLVYTMNDTLRFLLDDSKGKNIPYIISLVQHYVDQHREPKGWILEGDLERQ